MKIRIKNRSVIIMMMLSIFILFSCNIMENTDDIPGDKNAFDPITAIPEVSAFAGDNAVLMSLVASLIKADGTIDIDAEYKPRVQYIFINKLAPEKEENVDSDVPMGVTQTAKNTSEKAEYIKVIIKKPYKEERQKMDEADRSVVYRTFIHGGMERIILRVYLFSEYKELYQIAQAASKPLSFRTIWQKAIDLGAPSDNVVALISYDYKEGYTFEISQTDYKYKFDLTGKQID